MRTALDRPLILVLPLAEKARIKALVPDLWAVRRFSLDTGPWLAPAAPPSHPPAAAPAAPTPFPLDPTEQSLVEEWARLSAGEPRDRGALVAGERAYDVLLRRGRVDEARAVARWMVKVSRRLAGVGVPPPRWLRPLARLWSRLVPATREPPEALRDLSVSLNKVGGTDQALGDWAAARGAFAESLEISRRRLARVGETPEALRDLSVSLDNVGGTDQAVGDWAAARAAFAESLDIRRRLLARLGETPEALRDLSISLNKVGGTDQALGDWAAARAAFAESLEIRRRRLARLGETPEALRDLSISLNKVGGTDQALGDPEAARRAFREALEIAERLAAVLPDHVDYRDLPAQFRARLAGLDG